jgi:hypothetical protein
MSRRDNKILSVRTAYLGDCPLGEKAQSASCKGSSIS